MNAFDDAVAREEKMPGEQRSVEWMMARVGNVTGSRFGDVLDKLKNGARSAKSQNYQWEIICERMTGQPSDHYINAAMQWGIENEARAIMAYEAQTGAMTTQPGFIHHPSVAYCGGSVDGLIDDDGIIEIKCPSTATHIKTLLGAPCEYLPQIQGYLWITGRAWCDFVSYDPRMPQFLQLFMQRIERDDEYIAKLHAEVEVFLDEIQQRVTALHKIAALYEVRSANQIPAPQPLASDAAPESGSFSLPDAAAAGPQLITPDQAVKLETLCNDYGIDVEEFKRVAKVGRIAMIEASRFDGAVAWLEKRMAK